jgi:hypothetical protein
MTGRKSGFLACKTELALFLSKEWGRSSPLLLAACASPGHIDEFFPIWKQNLGHEKPPHQSSWSRPKLDKPDIDPHILTKWGKI